MSKLLKTTKLMLLLLYLWEDKHSVSGAFYCVRDSKEYLYFAETQSDK